MILSPRPPATTLRLLVFALLPLALCACVGRGKYTDALQRGAEAHSVAAATRVDYEDALRRSQRLERDYDRLRDSLHQQTLQALDERSGSIDERQELVNRVTLQGLLIDSLQSERDRLHRQRADALAVGDLHDARLGEVNARIASSVGAVLPEGLRSVRGAAALTVHLPGSLLFAERRAAAISPQGDRVLTALASALGGQPDLRIEVAASPRDFSGSPEARLAAGRRAALVASNLVEGHGLNPEIVAATALQRDAAGAPLAPAEAGDAGYIQVVVRLAGDPIGQMVQALRD